MVRDRLVLHLLGYFEMLISGDFSVYNQIDILKRVRLHITEGKTYSGKLYVSVLNKKILISRRSIRSHVLLAQLFLSRRGHCSYSSSVSAFELFFFETKRDV